MMQAQAFLLRCRELQEEYLAAVAVFREAKDACTRITAQTTGDVVSGSKELRKDSGLIRVAEDEERVRTAQRLRDAEFKAAMDLLQKIPEKELRLILYCRYLKGLKWREVWRQLIRRGYTYGTATLFRRHKDALEAAEKAWMRNE